MSMNELTRNVLLVEDNPDDVFLMRRALKKSGLAWSRQVVTDGQEALDFLRGAGRFANRAQFPLPSLIYLDLKLPYVDGFDVLTWMREQTEVKEMSVYVLTSSPEERDRRRAEELGYRKHGGPLGRPGQRQLDQDHPR